jgi:hypothetical protein
VENCERCGQPGTKSHPTYKYFKEGRWLHTDCFEEYADEVLRGTD